MKFRLATVAVLAAAALFAPVQAANATTALTEAPSQVTLRPQTIYTWHAGASTQKTKQACKGYAFITMRNSPKLKDYKCLPDGSRWQAWFLSPDE